MAYRRKSARKSYAKKSVRKSYRRAAPKRRKAASRRKSAPRSQRITLVIQQAPIASPTLATPAAKAAPVRARFGG